MASIIVATGKQKGDYYPLGHRTNVVGRDEALPIQILDEHVSRKHMQIRFDKDRQKFIQNDGSKNYRISAHPDFVTYDKERLLNHPDPDIRGLAKRLT